jgi:hypothetical protein
MNCGTVRCPSHDCGGSVNELSRSVVDMSSLDHIVEQVSRGERVTEEWSFLRNVYFRGDTGLEDLKKWAAQNGIAVRLNPPILDFYPAKIKAVTFVKK